MGRVGTGDGKWKGAMKGGRKGERERERERGGACVGEVWPLAAQVWPLSSRGSLECYVHGK